MQKTGAHFSDLPSSRSNLVDILHGKAADRPDQVAFVFLDRQLSETRLTLGELDRRARAIGSQLQSQCRIGECAVLLYPPGPDYIAALFGCLYAGVIAVPAYPPRANSSLTRIQSILDDSRAAIALTTPSILTTVTRQFASNPYLKTIRWVVPHPDENRVEGQWRPPNLNADDLALLQYTSGSTSSPRGVMISHGNVLQNGALIRQCLVLDDRDIVVSWLPSYHDMGLIGGVMVPLYTDCSVVMLTPASFLERPGRWLEAISTYHGTISGAPNFAYDLCVERTTPKDRDGLNLSSWRVAFCGAEPIRSETLVRFTRAFVASGLKPSIMYPTYGLAEATLVVTGNTAGPGPVVVANVSNHALETDHVVAIPPTRKGSAAVKVLVGCGQALDGECLVIAHPEIMTRCSADEVGEIWVQSPSVAQGYWNRPEESVNTFHAYLTDTGEGPFLRTGDLGFLSDGELFITGRLKDLVIIRGRNYYPQDIELAVERCHPALRPGCGAAFSVPAPGTGTEQLVIVHEVVRSYLHKANLDEIAAWFRNVLTVLPDSRRAKRAGSCGVYAGRYDTPAPGGSHALSLGAYHVGGAR